VTHWLSIYKEHFVRFQVLSASSMKMAVFWVAVPCSLVEVYLRFRGSCCLHNHGIPVDGGSKHLWNVGKPLADNTAQQPRRQPSSRNALISSNSDTKRCRSLPMLIQRTSDYVISPSSNSVSWRNALDCLRFDPRNLIKPTALTNSVIIYLIPELCQLGFVDG
jgi:hypothetical protein